MSYGEARPAAQPDEIYYQEREAEIYDLEYRWKTDDLDYWVALAKEFAGSDGSALELACGTGRVLVPVAERVSSTAGAGGVRVVGVDHSPWMLAKAKEKYERLPGEVQERIGLLEGDMRTLRLEQKFNFIYLPFNTFLILRTVEDQLAVFDVVRRHLAPGGVFAFDIFVPDVNRLAQPAEPLQWRLEVDETLGDLGVRFQRDAVREVDPLRQLILNTWRMREYRDNVLTREWVSDLQMSYVFPRELEHLVARAGFELIHYWGDYDRTDFWKIHGPQKQLPVLRPRLES
jgi:ubiquinone/menaquinone biosynthesis C-methylase UbiE